MYGGKYFTDMTELTRYTNVIRDATDEDKPRLLIDFDNGGIIQLVQEDGRWFYEFRRSYVYLRSPFSGDYLHYYDVWRGPMFETEDAARTWFQNNFRWKSKRKIYV